MNQCKDCKWWIPYKLIDDEREFGYCKRFPPTPNFDTKGGKGYSPLTFALDYCGEFAPKTS
jgi:hypothetical protein